SATGRSSQRLVHPRSTVKPRANLDRERGVQNRRGLVRIDFRNLNTDDSHALVRLARAENRDARNCGQAVEQALDELALVLLHSRDTPLRQISNAGPQTKDARNILISG